MKVSATELKAIQFPKKLTILYLQTIHPAKLEVPGEESMEGRNNQDGKRPTLSQLNCLQMVKIIGKTLRN